MAARPKNFIKKALPHSHQGDLHKALGIPAGQKIPQDVLDKAAKAPGKLGQMARFAETLEGLNKKK